MNTQQLIDDLGAVLRTQIARAKEIQQLPAEVLLRRPAADQWNAVEVFEHLNLSSGIYAKGLQKVFAKRASTLKPNGEFHPGLMGNYFTNGMVPKPDGRIAWRMKTMKMFDPARNHGASSESIARFITLCETLLQLLQQARTTDLNAMKVTSSLGPIIRFKAGDAFRFPVAHQQRHFLQIERLVKG
ncbi:MAG: DinB family protein [Flavobacteriales bacterium]|nr:DinB family protein [Flavobacteriales bacterium]